MPNCKFLVVHCIDFRIQKSLEKFLRKNKVVGRADIISVPGGCKYFLDKKYAPLLLNFLNLSFKLHHPKVLLLFQHQDCRAYGGEKSFKNSKEEIDFHKTEIKKLEAKVHKKDPTVKVRGYFVPLKGKILTIFS